eukprot:490167-Karenia_brevis.AAC.1
MLDLQCQFPKGVLDCVPGLVTVLTRRGPLRLPPQQIVHTGACPQSIDCAHDGYWPQLLGLAALAFADQ